MGIGLRLGCSPEISGNRIINNEGLGLLLETSQPKMLRNNEFVGNSEAALRNAGGGPVQAAGNWWGSARKRPAKVIQDREAKPEWERCGSGRG